MCLIPPYHDGVPHGIEVHQTGIRFGKDVCYVGWSLNPFDLERTLFEFLKNELHSV